MLVREGLLRRVIGRERSKCERAGTYILKKKKKNLKETQHDRSTENKRESHTRRCKA